MTQRYLIAKYAPDIFRMEPRNIGVVVWANGVLSAKYLVSDDADFVEDKAVYDRWINYWNRLVRERVITNGNTVSADDPAFLDAMRKTQDGNFMLLDGGRVLDEINADDIQSATEFLFSQLVAPLPEASATPSSSDKLYQASEALFEEMGLKERPDWRGASPVAFSVKGVQQEYPFNYVFGTTEAARAVFQRVPAGRRQSIYSTALMMEWIGQSVVRKKARRAALVFMPGDGTPVAETGIEILQQFATVIDVSNPSIARKQIEKAVA